MRDYHKIQTVFKRAPKTKRIIVGEYSLPEFEFLRDNLWVFTEKVNGTNIRIMWDGTKITYGGKTDDAQIPSPLLDKLKELFENKKELFKEIFNKDGTPGEVCLYGEGYGQKIQEYGELYVPSGVDFVLFDVSIGGWWLERPNIEDISSKFGVGVVPIIGEGTLASMVDLAQQGFKSWWGAFLAEGIVAKPKLELKNRRGERIVTKIKHSDFKS